jgi:predicted O-methyltransferase YrrM
MNQMQLIHLFQKYWKDVPEDAKNTFLNWASVGIDKPGVSPFEGFLIYFLVLENDPKSIFEMGTRYGSISFALSYAQRERGIKGAYTSTEINEKYARIGERNLINHGLYEYVDLIIGDGIILAPHNIDFCIIDSNHTYNFAKKYIRELFPKCQTGCVVFTHDHIPYTLDQPNKDGQINLLADLIETNYDQEQKAIKEYLLFTKKSYCFLEAITGGRYTPFNEEFHKELIKITGIDLFPQKKRVPQSILYTL